MTKQRKLILDIINNSPKHLTAEDIYFMAKRKLASIAVGTVYRNLGILVEAGLIRKITLPNSPDLYDRNIEPHEHLVCQKCGKITDLFVDDLISFFKDKTGLEVQDYDLILKHVCEDCKNR